MIIFIVDVDGVGREPGESQSPILVDLDGLASDLIPREAVKPQPGTFMPSGALASWSGNSFDFDQQLGTIQPGHFDERDGQCG